jgi:diguanylate cyclase (GGDEF)-like protein
MRRRLRAWAAFDQGEPSSAAPWSLPGGENFAFMRRTGTAMLLLGSITLLATLPMPDPDTSDHPAITVIAALLALGAVVNTSVRTYRPWFVRLTAVYGLLLVSALMAVARPIEATPFFYLWPMLFSAYFFSRRDVAVDLALLWTTLAVALFGWSNDPMKGVLLMGVGVSVTLTTVVVMLLREHLTDLIGQLSAASATDYLTGLLNRRAFDSELERQIERARRTGVPLALALFDLDHFKQINDRLGHAAGDRALCDFASLLKDEQRGGDTLARVGGEEFAVVLFGVGLEESCTFAERIGRELRDLMTADGIELSASAGVAALDAEHTTPSALVVAADRALYAAKAAGRRRVATWDRGSIAIGPSLDGIEQLALGAA